MINLVIQREAGSEPLAFTPRTLVIAGWTGRDAAVLEAHIEELAALGVARPNAVPIYYRVSASQITTQPSVEMVGREGSGEVEAVLWKHGGELFVGVGSDHTDRKLETVGITLSKQVCAKPVSAVVWPWREVSAHWDELQLRSTLLETGEVYQEGPVSGLRRPDELLAEYETREGVVPDGTVMFCGTLPVHGSIRFADGMGLELIDPVRSRALRHHYAVSVLPIAEA
jgi:hypothetical protein